MKKLVFILTVALLGVIHARQADAAPMLGPVISPLNGHTYYVTERSTWVAAEAEAVSLGGHLVTIRNQAENDWLFTTFGPYAPTPEGFWIGLNDVATEGTFVWSSGEPVAYTNWWSIAPNQCCGMEEDFVHMYGPTSPQAWLWNDLWQDNPWGPFPGIVELTSTVPEPGTLVLLGFGLTGIIKGRLTRFRGGR